MILIVNWFLIALSLVIVSYIIPGFEIKGFGTALIAAIVIGLVQCDNRIYTKNLDLSDYHTHIRIISPCN